VRNVVRKCVQLLHIIRVLRMNDQALEAVYRSLVIPKLLNAACAWWGFMMDDDNRIEAVVRRGARAGLYPVNRPAAAQLVEDCEDVLFSRIQISDHHTFYINCCRTQTRMTTNSDPGAITCHAVHA